MNFLTCPRCEWDAFEQYETHNYCFNCNYSGPPPETVPLDALKLLRLYEESL